MHTVQPKRFGLNLQQTCVAPYVTTPPHRHGIGRPIAPSPRVTKHKRPSVASFVYAFPFRGAAGMGSKAANRSYLSWNKLATPDAILTPATGATFGESVVTCTRLNEPTRGRQKMYQSEGPDVQMHACYCSTVIS
jgi:hypothetical protein